MTRKFNWRILLLMCLGAIGIAAIFVSRDYLVQLIHCIQQQGVWGPILLGLVYIITTVLLIPGSLVTIAAGFAFEFWIGVLTVWISATLGATAAFLVGRFLARGYLEQKVRDNPRFHALDKAVADQGFYIVLLTRLSPVFPFVWLNYFFGLTRVSLWKYMLASWIGMAPGTVMFVYIGTTIQSLTLVASGQRETTTAEWILFGVGLVATIIVTVLVTRLAQKALKKVAPEVSQAPQNDPAATQGQPNEPAT